MKKSRDSQTIVLPLISLIFDNRGHLIEGSNEMFFYLLSEKSISTEEVIERMCFFDNRIKLLFSSTCTDNVYLQLFITRAPYFRQSVWFTIDKIIG